MTVRQTLTLAPVLLLLFSCDEVAKAVAAAKNKVNSSDSGKGGVTIAEEVKVSEQSKPEVIAAFQAISLASRERNRVLLENLEGNAPANNLSYTAGIGRLDQSAREHGGLTKQVIDAVNATWGYEKSLFVPFDTMNKQVEGMKNWSQNQAVTRRGYVQIMTQEIDTFDHAIAYLERGEDPLLRQNFAKYRVPQEVTDEFFRIRELGGREIDTHELEMFREGRLSLENYRDSMTTSQPAKVEELIAAGDQHAQKSKEAQGKMIVALRKLLAGSGT